MKGLLYRRRRPREIRDIHLESPVFGLAVGSGLQAELSPIPDAARSVGGGDFLFASFNVGACVKLQRITGIHNAAA